MIASTPAIVAGLGRDVAERHRAVGQQQVYQNAAVVLGIPDPEAAKDFQRALARRVPPQDSVQRERRLDHEANLPRVRSLARRDRFLDVM